MNIVRNRFGKVMGAGCWADGFVPLDRALTLEQEVERNGLAPVLNRLMRQGRVEKAEELRDRYQQ